MAGSRRYLALLTVLLTAGTGLAVAPASSAAPATHPAPPVQPALHEWTGGSGTFALGPGSRIVVTAPALAGDASTFGDDLALITGLRLPVVPSPEHHAGDIVLGLGATGVQAQGYRLDIGDAVTIQGADATGAFYGEQTVEQLFKLGPLPHGSATDWPDIGHRGLMLDTVRHYYSPADIEQVIRIAAWQKMDVVHLHLTDDQAFRLQSSIYPGLASAQSYSQATITGFVELAQRYHITLVPEIDIPAHSSGITAFDPALRWDCSVMGGGMLDITKPATTEFVTNLLREFVPLFPNSPVFHLGGDEYPGVATQQQCPELVDYAKAHGFASTEDVIVDWQNQIDKVVQSLGRQDEIWNWWDVAGGATITPSQDMIIEAWTGSPDAYLTAGYDTVSSPGNLLYVVPGVSSTGSHPNDQFLYESWTPESNPHLLGFEVSHWNDVTAALPDAYVRWFGDRPDSVLAARTWGGPRAANLFAFEQQVDRIGPPPGLPNPSLAGTPLTGTPYGSGPASNNGTTTYDKAFDGDVSTYVDLAAADGGYTGIDLGHPAQVTAVRFVPRDASSQNTLRMVGGVFQGCTTGPASGCTDLATDRWEPTYDWMVLPVADQHAYRWLRYVSPDGGHTDVAEIQFYGGPPSPAHLDVPGTLGVGDNPVQATITNPGDLPLTQLHAALDVYSSDDMTPLATRVVSAPGAVPPHTSATVTWVVSLPVDASPGTTYRLDANLTWDGGATSVAATTVLPFPPTVSTVVNGAALPTSPTALAGTGAAGDTVTVTDGSSPVCAAVVGADGRWSCALTAALANGQHHLALLQTNPAGRPSPAVTVTVTFTIGAKPALLDDWSMNETSGTTVADSAGPYSGTRTGSAAITPGEVGNGLTFDGTFGAVSTGAPDQPTPWSVGIWVRPTATADTATLLASGTSALKLQQYNGTGKVGITRFGVADYVSTYTAPLNTWTYLTFVDDGTSTTVYANGQPVATISASIPLGRAIIGDPSAAEHLTGTIDELTLFGNALTPDQVAALYAASGVGTTALATVGASR